MKTPRRQTKEENEKAEGDRFDILSNQRRNYSEYGIVPLPERYFESNHLNTISNA